MAIGRCVSCISSGNSCLLLCLPVVVIELSLRATWPMETRHFFGDWEAVTRYLYFFVVGYVIFLDSLLLTAIKRTAGIAIGLGLLTSGVFVGLKYLGQAPQPSSGIKWYGFMILEGVNQWLWVSGTVGLASRQLNFSHSNLAYWREAAFPIYVLHLPVLAAVAYPMVRSGIFVIGQFSVIVLCTLGGSFAIYHCAIRPFRIVRPLFGLRTSRVRGGSVRK